MGLVGLLAAFSAPVANATDTCSNAAFRTAASARLPDCRAYELVTPDLNHAQVGLLPPSLRSTADGNALVYSAYNAPDHASSSQPLQNNYIRGVRDSARGWSGASLSPPLSDPVTSYFSFQSVNVSPDLSTTFEFSDQPLSGGSVPDGQNVFVGHPDGTYSLVTDVGAPFDPSTAIYSLGGLYGGTPDFSHVYFRSSIKQLDADPIPSGNAYSWSKDHGLQLVGILPNGLPAPNGAAPVGGALPIVSTSGRFVVFAADDKLYVREDDAQTVQIDATQRTNPDLNPQQASQSVGVTSDGSTILFASQSELTDDANTGRTGGNANDAGRDLYSYDTRTHELTDLTVDTNPADAAKGADVQLGATGPIVAATADGAYIYFVATGVLAAGATPGTRSLYVWHDGVVTFVARAGGLVFGDAQIAFDMTPDGRHIAFVSTDSLTSYDNSDPVTGQLHTEVFEASLGAPIRCLSCRPNGTRPTGDATMPTGYARTRKVSDDGSRVFFESDDAVLPHTSNGLRKVYEYSDGQVSLISAADSAGPAHFLDASASGDDVFFETYDELVPNKNGGDDSIYDARVGGGFTAATERCSGDACRPSATTAPALAAAGTLNEGDTTSTPGASRVAPKVVIGKLQTVTGRTVTLKIRVTGRGTLVVTGAGIRSETSRSSKTQTVPVRITLTDKASKTLRKKRLYRTRANVVFTDAAGHRASATAPLSFRTRSATRKQR